MLAGARTLPGGWGGNSCFRKFARANRGKGYRVTTGRGFDFAGQLGDSVDNRIAVRRDYEPSISDFIAREASGSSSFLDIGCNVGWFSCLVASLPDAPKHILSVDANPRMVEMCNNNMRINGFTARSMVGALGPEKGRTVLYIPQRRHSRASVGYANAGHYEDTRPLEVDMVPFGELLDRFPGGRCDLVKMDIEGYELESLRVVPAEIIRNVGTIIMEYSRENLEGCGFAGMTLGVLPWLDRFAVQSIDDDGRIEDVADPAGHSPRKITFVLRNRS